MLTHLVHLIHLVIVHLAVFRRLTPSGRRRRVCRHGAAAECSLRRKTWGSETRNGKPPGPHSIPRHRFACRGLRSAAPPKLWADRTGAVRKGALFLLLVAAISIVGAASLASFRLRPAQKFRTGSKVFTESVILGEIATQLARHEGIKAEHRAQLNGTRILWRALLADEIDAYPEYTGTLAEEIFAGRGARTQDDLRRLLRDQGVGMTASLGFNDTYAVGMRDEAAARLGVARLSDLRAHPELRFGFSNEFLNRKDGWPALKQRYALPQANVTGLDHDLAYRALASGTIDATDLYSTDAEIGYYKLRVLQDDLHLFPEYKAVFLYRLDLERRSPAAVAALRRLEGRIDEPAMIAMNARSKLEKTPESRVASDFITHTFGIRSDEQSTGTPAGKVRDLLRLLGQLTAEHLLLVGISLSAAVGAAVPLGVMAARRPRLGHVILGGVAALYTIPSLALLVFMIPVMHAVGLPAIGRWPAIVALFFYSLLPIVRNTHSGLTGIPPSLRESAEALGLPSWAKLWRVELPIASPSILAGIKTSAVINVGTATLGALIGAGGFGQPILTGIRLDDTPLILLGAIPAAALALLVQTLFDLLERVVVPRGLRLKGGT